MSPLPAAPVNAPVEPALRPMASRRALRLMTWLLESFGPLLAFWVALRLGGLVAAIVVSIATGVVLVARSVVRDRRVSPFTAFIAVSVTVFGVLDLHFRTGFFLKLEPALGNAATGVFFLASVLWGRPVVMEFAERAAGRPMTHVRRYLTGWTVAWSVYFFARAGAYVWMAYHLSLERALALRAVLGPFTFGTMFVLEWGLRRVLYGRSSVAPRSEGSPP